MSQLVMKSFRLPIAVVEKIQTWSQAEDLSQAEFLAKVLKSYELFQLQQQMDTDIKNASADKAYQKEQQDLANANFL